MNIPTDPGADPQDNDSQPPAIDTLGNPPPAAGAETRESPRSEGPGGYIGRFKILQQIGEGGFGSVFEAEQEHPVKRRVALKVIKLGMDTHDVIARFEAERQALAMMDHPHIARVLDAGATDGGRPYFVMELVRGEPMCAYCDRHNMSIAERLTLFEQVCQAVQHAHTKGIIHRDLKPNNVLVSTQEDQPFAKVIDFGIAKAISGRLTDKTLFTEQHQMIGTPLYMSPEQAEGSADIDTRTDIYSLGVLLYELLTGSTPFASATLRSAAYTEIQRIIREVEPPRPSARLAASVETLGGVANHRATESRKLTRMLRGELDWIVMKAIEKDRTRRYETANGLAMDVHRFLSGQPVLAAPPGVSYRLRKFARRNKVTVSAALVVAAALLAGILGFAWQARIAQRRAEQLQRVSGFQAEMLRQINTTAAGKSLSSDVRSRLAEALSHDAVPEAERGAQLAEFDRLWRKVNATDASRALIDQTILKPAVDAIDQQFRDQPAVDAALRQALAGRYADLGLYQSARPLQEQALAERRRLLGERDPDTLSSINDMGLLLLDLGDPKAAEPFAREALRLRREVLGADHPDTLASVSALGYVLEAEGQPGAAEPYYREAFDKYPRVLGPDHPETLRSIDVMGGLLFGQGKLDQAEPYLRDALQKRRRLLGDEHPGTSNSISNLSDLLAAQGNFGEAESLAREVLQHSRQRLGDEHPYTLTMIVKLGRVLLGERKFGEAARLLAAAEAACRDLHSGADAGRLGKFLLVLGQARTGAGQHTDAEANLLEAQAILSRSSVAGNDDRRSVAQALVDLYTAWQAEAPDPERAARLAESQRKLDNPVPASAGR